MAFCFQIAICTAFIVSFSVIRPWLKTVYQPRVKFATKESKKPPDLSIRPLAWLWPAYYISEMDTLDQIGMDSIMFLRFIAACFKFFAGALVVAIPLMIFNFHAPEVERRSGVTDHNFEEIITSSLHFLTMENLVAESKYYYVYSFATLLISIYAYVLFYWTWLEYVMLRKKYVKSLDYLDSTHCRTLLLSGISPEMQKREVIERLILNIHPEAEIDQIVYGRNFRELAILCEKHRKVNGDMEQQLDICI